MVVLKCLSKLLDILPFKRQILILSLPSQVATEVGYLYGWTGSLGQTRNDTSGSNTFLNVSFSIVFFWKHVTVISIEKLKVKQKERGKRNKVEAN